MLGFSKPYLRWLNRYTVSKKNTIIERAMVVLQLTANVTGPEYVAIMSTSWPAGKNIGKYAFKLKNIFVEVRAWSSLNVLVCVWILSQMSKILFSLGSLGTQIWKCLTSLVQEWLPQERELRVPRSSREDLAGPPRALADYVLS